MPKYNYSCSGCGEEFEIYHSMFETIDACILCESQDIRKKPSSFFASVDSNKAGSLVREYIEEAKKEVRTEKLEMTKERYD